MCLAMHRTSALSSSSFQRRNGAVKATKMSSYCTSSNRSLGHGHGPASSGGESSSHSDASRTTKPGYNKSTRPLPDGPGPSLPNRPKVDTGTCKFKACDLGIPATRTRPSKLNQFSHQRSSVNLDSPATQRKASNDSGYGSGVRSSHGNLVSNRRISRSLSHLSVDERNDLSPPHRGTTYLSDNQKSGLVHRQTSHENEHVDFKHTHNIRGDFRSTMHSDYTDPQEDMKRIKRNGHSMTSDELSNGHPTKNGYSLVDVDKTRKPTITALPGSDLKCSRNSSLSSSNSTHSPTERGSSDGLVGLRNLGNTCFMNSILQCLSHTQPLTEQLLRGPHEKGKLIQAFTDLIKSMWKPGNSNTVSPHTFKTQIQRFAPRFMGYSQQDAQEFLRFLLEGLHDDLNQVKSKPRYRQSEFPDSLSELEVAQKSWESYLSRDRSLMTDLFVGQLKSKLTFSSCNHTSVTYDPFWDLSLPIPRKSGSLASSSTGRRYSGADDGNVNIRDCMLSFTREDVLDGDERATCDKCKAKRKATKKFSIQRFPSILVLHLKRFSGFSFRSKLQSNVDFPMKLDLAEFSDNPQISGHAVPYSLYAVSNHSGSTYGGHYTAYCKHPISNEWHCFNDSRVEAISSSRVRGNQAYILFYERVNPKSSL